MKEKTKTVSTTEFKCRLARRFNITKEEAKELLKGFQNELLESFKNGERVLLYEFGSFTPRILPSGKRSNLISKELYDFPDTKVIYFKLATKQKDLINGRPYNKQIKAQKITQQ